MMELKSLRSKQIATFAILFFVVLTGVLYQYHYDRQKIYYRELIHKYGPEYDKTALPDYLIDVYTQWVVNGTGQGKKRKVFLDEMAKKQSPESQ